MSVFANVIYHDNEYARYCYHEHFKIQRIIIYYKLFKILNVVMSGVGILFCVLFLFALFCVYFIINVSFECLPVPASFFPTYELRYIGSETPEEGGTPAVRNPSRSSESAVPSSMGCVGTAAIREGTEESPPFA